jgi:hypothetical protein
MDLAPEVLSALQDAHDAEATASEMWHKQEHAFKQGMHRIPKLGKWFDKRHKEAYARQHDLRATIMTHGGVVDTNLGDTSYSDDPGEALKTACKTLDGLAACHQKINDVTRDAAQASGDDSEKANLRGIREKFHGYAKDLHRLYRKGEHKQQMLKDLGLPLFIAKHS